MSVEIRKGGFEKEKKLPFGVNLWNISPKWPTQSKSRLTEEKLSRLLETAYDQTVKGGFLMLWMPAAEFHRALPHWNVADDAAPWEPISTLVSGMGNTLKVGVMYGKGVDVLRSPIPWGYHCIHDFGKRAGSTSTLTVKWMLERVFPNGGGGLVVDPFAHRKAVLATYCRRRRIRYLGYIRSKKGYRAAQKVLAQVELPGLQMSLV